MLLPADQQAKLDESSDALFYQYPRFVNHVDDGFIQQLTDLYRERLKPHSRILDLMSSWVSHLPEEIEFEWVEGHGMNEAELARNPRLSHYFVQNLNQTQTLPLADHTFDAVLNTVSIQYLQYPDQVFAEIFRILRPGGIAVISFSNRMFYQKAIAVWRDRSEASRVELVKRYFQSVKGFSTPEIICRPSSPPSFLRLLGIASGDPFYAVIGERMEPLVKA